MEANGLTWEDFRVGDTRVTVDSAEEALDFLAAVEADTDIRWSGEELPTEWHPRPGCYSCDILCCDFDPGRMCYSERSWGVPYRKFLEHARLESNCTQPDMAAFASLLGGVPHA